jgi:hypothetical protein
MPTAPHDRLAAAATIGQAPITSSEPEPATRCGCQWVTPTGRSSIPTPEVRAVIGTDTTSSRRPTQARPRPSITRNRRLSTTSTDPLAIALSARSDCRARSDSVADARAMTDAVTMSPPTINDPARMVTPHPRGLLGPAAPPRGRAWPHAIVPPNDRQGFHSRSLGQPGPSRATRSDPSPTCIDVDQARANFLRCCGPRQPHRTGTADVERE